MSQTGGTIQVIHKRKAMRDLSGVEISACGRYGATTYAWKKVTCEACIKLKPKVYDKRKR